ncbi:hypothetical protein RFI_02798 [Reticulomyxa filosa]|uniref:Transmembrane protein n=1 Tax=Reticulomyxa filosa TaxID=46433 RepID=X6P9I7_RETFI|nr:hypothetical protein RFI_02798 [Reticulomyxa filosa]|eukprot:ETO34297.1 hypothetical protein RFI_02798 [Reticulomyxa filosa]
MQKFKLSIHIFDIGNQYTNSKKKEKLGSLPTVKFYLLEKKETKIVFNKKIKVGIFFAKNVFTFVENIIILSGNRKKLVMRTSDASLDIPFQDKQGFVQRETSFHISFLLSNLYNIFFNVLGFVQKNFKEMILFFNFVILIIFYGKINSNIDNCKPTNCVISGNSLLITFCVVINFLIAKFQKIYNYLQVKAKFIVGAFSFLMCFFWFVVFISEFYVDFNKYCNAFIAKLRLEKMITFVIRVDICNSTNCLKIQTSAHKIQTSIARKKYVKELFTKISFHGDLLWNMYKFLVNVCILNNLLVARTGCSKKQTTEGNYQHNEVIWINSKTSVNNVILIRIFQQGNTCSQMFILILRKGFDKKKNSSVHNSLRNYFQYMNRSLEMRCKEIESYHQTKVTLKKQLAEIDKTIDAFDVNHTKQMQILKFDEKQITDDVFTSLKTNFGKIGTALFQPSFQFVWKMFLIYFLFHDQRNSRQKPYQ